MKANQHRCVLTVNQLEDRMVPAAVLGPTGVLTVEGTMGADQISITQTGNRVDVRMNNETARFTGVTAVHVSAMAGEDNVALNNFLGAAVVWLGKGNDRATVTGTRAAEVRGDLGDDTINGGAGGDLLVGGEGNDVITGGGGNDQLVGQGGDDRLYGQDGSDVLDGGDGNDYLDGGLGVDRITTGIGFDYVRIDRTVTGSSYTSTPRGSSATFTWTWDTVTDADLYRDTVVRLN